MTASTTDDQHAWCRQHRRHQSRREVWRQRATCFAVVFGAWRLVAGSASASAPGQGTQRLGEPERRQRLPHAVDGEVEDDGGAAKAA